VFAKAIIAADINEVNVFDGTVFTGTFDGKGHNLTNFSINGENNSYIGLFGCINSGGSVSNLVLENCQVSGSDYVGSLVGYNNGGIISKCGSTGTVNVYPQSHDTETMLEPQYNGNFSLFFTPVAVSGFEYVGGLAGYNKGTINQCYSDRSVAGYSAVGGIAGRNDGDIRNCYSISIINGNSGSCDVGGLAGYQYGGNISSSYSVGKVRGFINVGGLIGGSEESSSVAGSFWDIQSSGQATSAGGTGKTTEEMKMRWAFTRGWDFVNV
jgi:hypothetical protein